MKKKITTFVYWTPRILAMIFIFFLFLMSLDIFSSELSLGETVFGLFMHNIPALVLLVVLLISWKYEIVGGIVFILAGIFYIASVLITAITTGFEWYYLSWAVQISGIAFFIGIMFLVGWFRKK